jgi:poly(3-hydroxybutyrate) depolymerase
MRVKDHALVRIVLSVAILAAVLFASDVATAKDATAARTRSAGHAVRAEVLEPVQAFTVPYFTWNGKLRSAIVLLPIDYVPGPDAEMLPCVVQSPGRRATPAGAASTWGSTPSTRGFMVICVDQVGRRDPLNSWGVAGQIHDLVRMPDIVELTLPGVHVDRERLYSVGVSMGGQEALLALAFHPEHWAAGLCVDGVADLAARYREFALVDRLDVRPLMRAEVGGSPDLAPFAYAVRSPITFTRTLATSGVPLAIWWSAEDQLVINQATTQTGSLYGRILALNPAAPVVQRVGTGGHGLMLRRNPDLAVDFLCPGGEWLRRPPAPARWEYSGWEPSSDAWGYRFSTVGQLEKRWRVGVVGDQLIVRTPSPLTIRVPYSDDRPAPALVQVNGVRSSVEPRDGVLRIATPKGASTVVIDP